MKLCTHVLGKSTLLKLAFAGAFLCAVPSFATVTTTFMASGINGLGVSGTAQFSITRNVGDTVGTLTITLTNTTPVTNDAAQLLTGVDFTLKNGATNLSSLLLTSATGQRISTIDSTTKLPNFMGVGPIEWDPVNSTVTSPFQLRWNGDNGAGAQDYGIIGLPEGPGGTYADANSGLTGSSNHSPFTYYQGVFVLTSADLFETTTLTAANIRFGTGATPFTLVPVPEPSSVMIFGLGLGVACLGSRFPRRVSRR